MALEIHFDTVDTAPIDSATVMVLRDGPQGLEVLMVRRHGDSGVLGGVHVFPGGKLDATDGETAIRGEPRPSSWYPETLGEPTLSPAVARGLFTAAVRESREECGLDLPVDTLWPWSRWITPRQPSVSRKRFDTRFFVAPAPLGQEAVHDDFEATEVVWVAPRDGLRRYWAGAIDLAPPQIMSLAHLARHASAASVLHAARCQRPPTILPEAFEQDGLRTICYPGDPLHSVPERALPGPTRLRYQARRFAPEDGFDALFC